MVRRSGGDDAKEDGALVVVQIHWHSQPLGADDVWEVQTGGGFAGHPIRSV